MIKKLYAALAAGLMAIVHASPLQAEVVTYEFDIKTATVNFTGTSIEALTVAGGIPAPLIEAKVGDTLRVTFHNKLDTVSSVHWHGILLPNEQDGVPFLTTRPQPYV